MISHKALLETVVYCRATGNFYWRVKPSKRIRQWSVAGTQLNTGYIQIKIAKRFYLAHRLAVFYMTGKWPKDEVDHVNRIRDDNSWWNLREASLSKNCVNRPSRLKFQGVEKRNGGFIAYMKLNYKKMHLGCFDTLEEAAEVARLARIQHFGEFANQ